MAINNPLIPGDPYSYDLKWIVKKLKEAIKLYAPIRQEVRELYEFVHTYFEGDEFAEKLDEAIQQLLEDGTLRAIIQPIFDEFERDVDAELAALQARVNAELAAMQSQLNTAISDMQTEINNQSAEIVIIEEKLVNLPYSNENLLDNPYFQVNQRGIVSGGTMEYAADRWRAGINQQGNFSWERTDDGCIKLIPRNRATIGQRISQPIYDFLLGKKVTGSILLQDGTLYTGTTTVGIGDNYFCGVGTNGMRFLERNKLMIDIYGSPWTIKALKLELGEISTLMKDVADYNKELERCKLYFRRLSSVGAMYPVGLCLEQGNVMIPLPFDMVKIPSTNAVGTIRVTDGNANYVASKLVVNKFSEGQMILTVSTNGAAQIGTPYMLSFDIDASTTTPAYIDLSADIE